jgi:hypothetical protein
LASNSQVASGKRTATRFRRSKTSCRANWRLGRSALRSLRHGASAEPSTTSWLPVVVWQGVWAACAGTGCCISKLFGPKNFPHATIVFNAINQHGNTPCIIARRCREPEIRGAKGLPSRTKNGQHSRDHNSGYTTNFEPVVVAADCL